MTNQSLRISEEEFIKLLDYAMTLTTEPYGTFQHTRAVNYVDKMHRKYLGDEHDEGRIARESQGFDGGVADKLQHLLHSTGDAEAGNGSDD